MRIACDGRHEMSFGDRTAPRSSTGDNYESQDLSAVWASLRYRPRTK